MIQINKILQAVLEEQPKTPEVTNVNRDSIKTKSKWNKNDYDMPNSQRLKRRHPKSNSYYHSCGYDLPHKHDSKTWNWKKRGTKIWSNNQEQKGGLERTYFQYTCKWKCGRIYKKLSSLNQIKYKPKDLNETFSKNSSISKNKKQDITKKLA